MPRKSLTPEPDTYEPAIPPPEVEWKEPAPIIIKRPLISINFAGNPIKTIWHFLLMTAVTLSIESMLYLLIAGVASATHRMEERVETITIREDVDKFGDPFTTYPALFIVLGAVYVIVMVIWWFNRTKD